MDYSFPAEKVVRLVNRVIAWRGKPEGIRTDNGTEFAAKAFKGFCSSSGIEHRPIQKGRPMQNGYIERFNRTFREGVLARHAFQRIGQGREITEVFLNDYNYEHPHSSLASMTPVEFMKLKSKIKTSNFTL